MSEREDERGDLCEEYRLPDSPHWENIRPTIESIFEGGIPEDLLPHLIEWSVIRGKGHGAELNPDQLNNITSLFSDFHDKLFDNLLFVQAIRTISSRLPLAG